MYRRSLYYMGTNAREYYHLLQICFLDGEAAGLGPQLFFSLELDAGNRQEAIPTLLTLMDDALHAQRVYKFVRNHLCLALAGSSNQVNVRGRSPSSPTSPSYQLISNNKTTCIPHLVRNIFDLFTR